MPLLETNGLGKSYRGRTAVAGLDLEIGEAEIVGLLGPNGAGKTTAISMIAGVLPPTRGRARICGNDVAREPFAAKRWLGLVPQEIALYDDLTADENLRFFAAAHGIKGAAADERIDWGLAIAGLDERRGERVVTYSGGMKRRLNLAAGLLHRPRLLILDEPTVGVDPQSRKHIFDTVRRLRDEHGMSVLYTSHYMEEVEAMCERVVILEGGEVIAAGRIDELVAEHASGVLEVDLAPGADVAAAAAAARGEVGEDAVVVADGRLEIEVSGPIAPVIAAVEEAGGAVRGIRSAAANLETVFLHLTGHRLRD